MATKSALTTYYDWGDGKGAIHNVSKEQHAANVDAKKNPKLAKPAPGTYDPNLDAEAAKSTRGLADLTDDIGVAKTQNLSDYQIGLQGVDTASGRSLSDLLTARTRGNEDYGTSIAGVQRNFANLGTAQAGQQRKSGTYLGGAAQQAAEKRATNEALARAPIDTAHDRFLADSTEGEKRIGDDRDTQKGALKVQYTRADDPLTNQLSRAKREDTYFQGDSAKARQFQANQLGYSPQFLPPPTIKATGGVQSLTAAPGLKGTTKKRKGRTVTYGASVGGP